MSKKSSLEAKPSATTSSPTGPTASETTPLISDKSDDNSGLSVKQAAMLLTGEMAGSGVLALPRALVKTGWVGVPIMVLMCGMAAFSGKRLADCWTILEERDPLMRTRKRNPYAIIVEQTMGKTCSVIVSMAMLFTLFGASVVYLLMAAQIVEQIFLSLAPTITYCAWFLIVSGAMSPLLMLPTPKDFSYLGILAFGSTILACILYFTEMMNEVSPFVFRFGIHKFLDFFLAFGTIMFAFGATSTFPTIQNDMADKSKFTKSLQYSFIAILVLYLTIAITGYAVYGENASSNLAMSLKPTALTLVGNVLMVVQLVSAFIILINPVCQEIEELYSVPRDSAGGRILVRLSIMLAILFIGESIPRFQTILALIGGTSIALLTFALPPFCYLKLSAGRSGETRDPEWMKIVCWHIIAVGVVGGILATISAASAIFSTAMVKPCYLT